MKQKNNAFWKYSIQGNNLKIIEDELKLRGMSKETIKAYMFWNSKFLEWIEKSAREVSKNDIERFMLYLHSKGLQPATRHLAVSALVFYYETLLKRRFHLKHPKRDKKLPTVLTKAEIEKMIAVTDNIKHKLLIMLLYSSGLRLSEAVKLKRSDLFVEENMLKVRNGKGGKDRFVVMSKRFLELYFQSENHVTHNSDYLFPGRKGHIHKRTVQEVLNSAAKKSGIAKNVHPHCLRASFATHLIENGTDISFVQKLMGHSRIETTQGYLRLSNAAIRKVKSPMDY